MHIPDGFVSAPISAAAFAGAAVVCGVAVARAEKTLGERQIPLVGVTAAFVFAAQMLNFPVAAGTSGHFMGAALAAILLGPLNGALVMALVVIIQCLLFADGGLTALGTNILNMGVIGGMGGYGVCRVVSALAPSSKAGFLAAAAVASWSSVVLASSACAVELGLSGTYPVGVTLPAMAGIHAAIGLGEALVTTMTLSTVLIARPDLVPGFRPQEA